MLATFFPISIASFSLIPLIIANIKPLKNASPQPIELTASTLLTETVYISLPKLYSIDSEPLVTIKELLFWNFSK